MTLWTGCFCRLLSENTKGLERILITYLLTRSLKTRKWDGLSDCSFPDWGGHLRTATERFLIFICRVSFFSYWTAQRPRAPVTRAHLLDCFFFNVFNERDFYEKRERTKGTADNEIGTTSVDFSFALGRQLLPNRPDLLSFITLSSFFHLTRTI